MLVLSYQRLCATTQSTEKEEEWDPAIWLETGYPFRCHPQTRTGAGR